MVVPMLRLSFALIASVMLSACANPSDIITKRPALFPDAIDAAPAAVMPSLTTAEVDDFARSFLDSIQPISFAKRSEFCGYFFQNAAGKVAATPPRRGTFASCSMPVPTQRDNIIASYHTHGAFGPEYDNEVPSSTDLLSDFDLGMNGYIATPGGRIWRVNHADRDAEQVCGLKCVTSDPGFIPRDESSVLQVYTVSTLLQRHGS